ncbi:competence type IV pilus minor pilin ComGF [Sporolactobacillus vineae]|uniref:competence type IV pilus minor pilin ComGF n=1 Tax=Sporolactobacillus vineae TaxID=444463 RepID=UPI00028A26D1|nr:competence type IV pilus minor pilin ComGF [Sporolactobacillus vineae]
MNHQKGYTLLSMMLALSIMMITLGLVISLIHVLAARFQDDQGSRQEVSLFFLQTASELNLSDSVRTAPDHQQLVMKKGTSNIVYQKLSKQRIVRQVDGAGYEIVLQHVKSAEFYSDGRYMMIKIVDSSDRQYFWADLQFKN